MKRMLVSGSFAVGLGLLLSVAGCGGGGVDEGAPQDTTPGVPLNTVKTEMKSIKPIPPPKETPPPAAAGTEEKKKAEE